MNRMIRVPGHGQARRRPGWLTTFDGRALLTHTERIWHLQFAVRLLETRIVTREAMKAPPAKSVLDSGNLNVTRTADVANEILNEMQRNRGGDTVEEDESRYQVTIRRPDSTETADWTGEVVGPPALFPLKTVNVLTAGKTVIVFDKTNKKLWQATLAYSVLAGSGILGGGEDAFSAENRRMARDRASSAATRSTFLTRRC